MKKSDITDEVVELNVDLINDVIDFCHHPVGKGGDLEVCSIDSVASANLVIMWVDDEVYLRFTYNEKHFYVLLLAEHLLHTFVRIIGQVSKRHYTKEDVELFAEYLQDYTSVETFAGPTINFHEPMKEQPDRYNIKMLRKVSCVDGCLYVEELDSNGLLPGMVSLIPEACFYMKTTLRNDPRLVVCIYTRAPAAVAYVIRPHTNRTCETFTEVLDACGLKNRNTSILKEQLQSVDTRGYTRLV